MDAAVKAAHVENIKRNHLTTPVSKDTEKKKVIAAKTEDVKNSTGSAQIICPKCGAPMVLRTAKKGSNSGNQFYGCTNFPKCRGIKSL